MSSFIQKNRSTEGDIALEQEISLPCPECGQISMRRMQSDCALRDGTFIPNLHFYFCSSCQSRFFDDASMKAIEAVRRNN